jgi:hypothetical protein
MSKRNSAAERDALLAQMIEMSTKPDSPGSEQAKKAVRKKAVEEKEAEVLRNPAQEVVEAETKLSLVHKKKVSKRREEKAEKVSISLHPIDQERAERVEDALRKAGLIARRASTSLLLKVALAAFDPSKVEDLPGLVEEIKSQDGRGKWMKAVR